MVTYDDKINAIQSFVATREISGASSHEKVIIMRGRDFPACHEANLITTALGVSTDFPLAAVGVFGVGLRAYISVSLPRSIRFFSAFPTCSGEV